MALRILRVAVAVLVVAVGVPSLIAMPEYDEFWNYYSDDTFQTQVGYIHYRCDGTYYSGTYTEYLDISLGYHCVQQTPHPDVENPSDWYMCSDGIDNDGDGRIDCRDLGCDCIIDDI